MQQVSVFDVAQALIDRSGSDRIETVKLQKLCFYAFGWYAHLTGEALFPETFYAMQKGPVVGELLSAHAGDRVLTRDQLLAQLAARESMPVEFSAYVEHLLDFVWQGYGARTSWELVEATHEEQLWVDAWSGRRSGTRRGDLPQSDIIDFFRIKPRPTQDESLPLSCVSQIDEIDLAEAIRAGQAPHAPFVEALRVHCSQAS